MGTLTYNGWVVSFEDRLLTHLHLVIMQRLRNDRSFAMSWINSVEDGSGRGSIWLHPSGDLGFRFIGSKFPTINPAWIATLASSAEGSQGLIVTGEDGELARSESIRVLTRS
jgi:hypothetical protein